GFSTSDASLASFPPATHWVAILLMVMGSLPFMLYVSTLRGNYKALVRDQQVRGFLMLLTATCLLLSAWLWLNSDYAWADALRIGSVNAVSIISTTGFALGDYTQWGGFAVMVFFYLTFIGGCSGSSTGGLKIFRFQVAYTLLRANMQQLIHPRAVIQQKYNGHPLDEEIVRSILTFSFFFTITIGVVALGLALLGLDPLTALSGAATAVCNVGPGLGSIIGPAGNFASLPDAAKWLLSAGMLLARRETPTWLGRSTPPSARPGAAPAGCKVGPGRGSATARAGTLAGRPGAARWRRSAGIRLAGWKSSPCWCCSPIPSGVTEDLVAHQAQQRQQGGERGRGHGIQHQPGQRGHQGNSGQPAPPPAGQDEGQQRGWQRQPGQHPHMDGPAQPGAHPAGQRGGRVGAPAQPAFLLQEAEAQRAAGQYPGQQGQPHTHLACRYRTHRLRSPARSGPKNSRCAHARGILRSLRCPSAVPPHSTRADHAVPTTCCLPARP